MWWHIRALVSKQAGCSKTPSIVLLSCDVKTRRTSLLCRTTTQVRSESTLISVSKPSTGEPIDWLQWAHSLCLCTAFTRINQLGASSFTHTRWRLTRKDNSHSLRPAKCQSCNQLCLKSIMLCRETAVPAHVPKHPFLFPCYNSYIAFYLYLRTKYGSWCEDEFSLLDCDVPGHSVWIRVLSKW